MEIKNTVKHLGCLFALLISTVNIPWIPPNNIHWTTQTEVDSH